MGRMPFLRVVLLAVLAALLAGCGGSGGSSKASGSGGSDSSGGGSLSASVSDAEVSTSGPTVTASVKIRVGGVAQKRVTLEWGLVDAALGQESQAERVVHRYVTTRETQTDTRTVKFRLPVSSKPFLVHFVLYGPDGSYLASKDTDEFQTSS